RSRGLAAKGEARGYVKAAKPRRMEQCAIEETQLKRDAEDAYRAAPGILEEWFAANGWRAFDFQREVWNAYLSGESGLVHSATGSGKTLAAWLGPLAEGLQERPDRTSEPTAPPVRVIWITPMRALAADTVLSLQRAADGLGTGWTV